MPWLRLPIAGKREGHKAVSMTGLGPSTGGETHKAVPMAWLRFPVGGKRETHRAAGYGAVFSLFCWLLFGLLLENLALSALIGLICFFPVFGLLLYYPKIKRRQYAGLVEAGIPFCLMNIAIELNLGVAFINALQHASDGKDVCAREFRAIVKEVREQGASVQEALRDFSERIDSRLVKRAVTQLLAAFEQGNSKNCGEPIKRIAAEILTRQRVESKLFSGKMVVSGMLFIAVSAIVPALFQSFSIVGSVILQMRFTAVQLFLIIVAGFPLLDIAVLFYIRSKTPAFLRGQ